MKVPLCEKIGLVFLDFFMSFGKVYLRNFRKKRYWEK